MQGQTIREAVVKRTAFQPVIDGSLADAQWQAAEFTEKFVKYQNGVNRPFRAKFTAERACLFVGFVARIGCLATL
jgi:hypothetical protein